MTSPTTVTIIHCWSAPRSRSTALLYSFEARGDECVAIDEPLYREWLVAKKDVVERPYMEPMVSPAGSSEEKWEREKLSLKERIENAIKSFKPNPKSPTVVFCKHMAKHAFLYELENNIPIENAVHKHVLLIRDPVAVLSSWKNSSGVHGNSPSPDEVGIIPMLSIYSLLTSSAGQSVVILDSDDIAQNPAGTLERLCSDLDIPWTERMLKWESGPHACDGAWAPWWYNEAHKSDGWKAKASMAPLSKYPTLDPGLMHALRASMPAYEYLKSLSYGHCTRGPRADQIYEDPRNKDLLVWVGTPGRGRLVPRDMARISPWDSSAQGGDGAWEGLRLYRGKILSLDKHLRRLFKSAKALGYENVHTMDEIIEAIFRTLAANGMRDGAHVRLTLTRGEKCALSMNPKFNVYGTTLIVLPEWKPTEGATTYDNTKGISLISASQQRNSPSTVDSKIHHNNMINNILAKIQANLVGAADAIVLDLDGFVSETNAANIFMVDDGVLLTPHADHCLPGITRETVIQLAKELGIPCFERRVSLAEFYAADEVFTAGTMGELTPVTMIDGRVIGKGVRGIITTRLQEAYKTLPERDGWATPIPEFASVR